MKHAAIALLLLSVAGLSAQATFRKEFTPLQGTWDVVEAPGMKDVPRGFAGLIFTGEKYEGFQMDRITERGTVSLDSSHRPLAIALVVIEGTDAGKTQLGLIEIDGDKMRLLLNTPGDPKVPLASSKDWLTLKRYKK
jgi:uncharacterized protein (TIGR03067 family)